ncbi:MAG: V-type ATP synthase subunit F [Nitrosopumilus sp.]|jgi:V/A-type H+-transporting ATPase subunit F|nr:V-type ATP synthase subunit F [Nitrosopumilus sp.]
MNSLVFQTKSTFPDPISPKRVKLEQTKFSTVKIFTVGSKSFVTSFQLAGIPGKISENPQNALEEIKTLTDDSDVGLVLVSDDITESINDELTALRAEKSTLVFALPATGSEKTEVDYRVMLKKILGV